MAKSLQHKLKQLKNRGIIPILLKQRRSPGKMGHRKGYRGFMWSWQNKPCLLESMG